MKVNTVNGDWLELELTTHQDHVIAHVIDATILGYFVHDETIYFVLDMGFVWSLYLDGQMVLLPSAVALRELEIEPEAKNAISHDVDVLLSTTSANLSRVEPTAFTIAAVNIFEQGDRRLVAISDGERSMRIELSMSTGAIEVFEANA